MYGTYIVYVTSNKINPRGLLIFMVLMVLLEKE